MTSKAKLLMRELVAEVLKGREDAAVLRPVLTVMVRTAVQDFERYHDARHARARVIDHDILMAWNKVRSGRSGKTSA